jgi:two-component system, cell cycle response regulator
MQEQRDGDCARHQILVVDDDAYMRETLRELISNPDYAVLEAVDGKDAIEQARQHRPDLVLLDVMMPDMDGFEVCRRMRDDAVLAELSIVMVTALDDRQARVEGVRAGADDFITKPVDPQLLQARVRTTLRLNRYRRLLEARQQFEWVVENSEDGLVIIDAQDNIQYMNPQARRYLGVAHSRLPRGDFMRVVRRRCEPRPEIAWRDWPSVAHSDAQRLDGTPPRYLVRPETDVSGAFWMEVTVLDVNSTGSAFLVRLRDISERVTEHQKVYEFEGQISHKLRTPLGALVGSLELIETHLADLEPAEQHELIGMALSGARRLQDTLLRILDYRTYVQVETGARWFHPEVLGEIVDRVRFEQELNNVEVVNNASGDRMSALSVMSASLMVSELLANSRKFHPEQTPNVVITLEDGVDDGLVLRVVDNGCQLSPAQLQRIWTPYYQGERDFTGQTPGIGLGLSLVAILIWNAGGSYRAYNREDCEGLVVEIEIPKCKDVV